MIISFAGPFSWEGAVNAPSIYDVPEGREPGVYLWTVPLQEGHLIYYVGETGKSFGEGLRQHYREYFAAKYHVYSPAEFARGERVALWPGFWGDENGANRKSKEECQANRERLNPSIQQMVSILRFFVAPLSCQPRTRWRIKDAISQPLFALPGKVGAFQELGLRRRQRKKDEEPIDCFVSSPVRLLGLADRFMSEPFPA
jgi:hypothetical protein